MGVVAMNAEVMGAGLMGDESVANVLNGNFANRNH